MLAFPGMLVGAARKANMAVPDDPDQIEDLDAFKQSHPHFWVFCLLQLGRPMRPGEHWENAEVIAAIPLEHLVAMTPADFVAAGVCGTR